MDFILGTFAEMNLPSFSEEELDLYKELLMNNDPDLYDWYTGKADLPEKFQNAVFEKFLAHEIPQTG